MPVKLIIAPETEQDIGEAYAWYEERRVGLGDEFLSCIEASLESIQRTPEISVIVYENYRRALVRRFPYAIFYEYENEMVIIYGVFHTARDPNKWRQRLT